MRQKPFGERVTAPDIERLPEDIGPTHFVRVCGALIRWALGEHGAPSADLRIAERLTVPDRGADAECSLPSTTIELGGLVGPGRTIYQFKYRDVGATDRRAIVNSLVTRLREELKNLPAGAERYVLMTNISLAGTQPSRLREAIASGAPALSTKPIVVWGAAEIANALNASPGLRHLFAAAGGLSTIDIAEAELRAAYRRVGWAPFLGRAHELSALREFIESDSARVLQVRGASLSGRTRLVIEAMKRWAPLALWAASAEHVDNDLLRDLDSGRRRGLLVVDDDDDDAVRRVRASAEQRERLKIIVIARGETLHGGESDPSCIDVREMERAESDTLLRILAPGTAFAERSWIIDGTSGLPGLIAHLAALLTEPRLRSVHDPEDFRRRLAHILRERYEVDLEPGERQALQIASLFPVLGVEGTAAFEVAAVAKALDLDPGVFAAHRVALERAGLLRPRGRFVEVVPPLLAEHLAAQALTNTERVIAELEIVLSHGRFLAFLRRLSKLPNEGVRSGIERLLWERCAGFDGLQRYSEVIHTLAPAAPQTAIRCIEEALKGATIETLREALTGDQRRALVETIEGLAYRSESFESAAKHLLVLAEAEDDSKGSNATGTFLSLFPWVHPALPATLSQRLAVLKQGAASGLGGRRKVVASAAGAAFKEREVFRGHHPSGPHLPEPRFRPQTWEEIGRYGLGVLEVLELLRSDAEAPVRAAATAAVIEVFRPLIWVSLHLTAPSEGVLPELAQRVFTALGSVGRAAESARTSEVVASQLELLTDDLSTAAEHGPVLVDNLRRMAAKLETDLTRSLRERLWRALGPPSWEQLRHWLNGAEKREGAIQAIATEILEDRGYPALLESHLEWLTSEEARSGNELFRLLGARDTRRGVLTSLLAHHLNSFAEDRFIAYFSGWVDHDRTGAQAAIDRLITSRPDLDRPLLGAAVAVFPGHDLAEAVRRILVGSASERYDIATRLASLVPWETLSGGEAERLLTLVDDGTPKVRGALLAALAVRFFRGGALPPALREVAWSFLNSASALTDGRPQSWWDDLAAHLGEAEPQRLLALVEGVGVQVAREERGTAAWHREIPLTFGSLRKADRPGFVRMLLRLASCPNLSWRVETAVEEEIEPSVDRETLLAFAREAGVEGARTVALHLSAEKPGFWEVARDLLAEWGEDKHVRERLLSALPGDGWSGSARPMLKERLDRAVALRSDPSPWVASWAQEAMSFFEAWRRDTARDEQEDWIWDYRIRRADLENMVHGQDSSEKLWAIGRLLEHAPDARVRELLTPAEILDALDKIPQLPERVRARWEPWARHWAGRH